MGTVKERKVDCVVLLFFQEDRAPSFQILTTNMTWLLCLDSRRFTYNHRAGKAGAQRDMRYTGLNFSKIFMHRIGNGSCSAWKLGGTKTCRFLPVNHYPSL